MSGAKLCRACGLEEADHHDFDPAVPDGCVCDPGEYVGALPAICATFVGTTGQNCATCEHDEECHAGIPT